MSNSQRVAAALAAATDTVAMEIGIGILDRLPHIFAEAFPNKRLWSSPTTIHGRPQAAPHTNISRPKASHATSRIYSPPTACMPNGTI